MTVTSEDPQFLKDMRPGNLVCARLDESIEVAEFVRHHNGPAYVILRRPKTKYDREICNLFVKPIPITIKRLEKLLFSPVGGSMVKDDLWLYRTKEGYKIKLGKNSQLQPIKYIHDLQNMYFDFHKREIAIYFDKK